MDAAPRLVVVAGAWDRAAYDFVARHEAEGAVLLVPRDLSRPGWQVRLGEPASTVAVSGERRFRLADAGGVLIRLPAITADDLPHIHEEDRAYVASELSAFLLALLTRDDVPVLNRPTPLCLCGPGWQEAGWRRAAAGLGLPVAPMQAEAIRGAQPGLPVGTTTQIAVIGETWFGAPDPQLGNAATMLARLAETAMLTVEFAGCDASAGILGAAPHVDLTDPTIAAAVLGLFGMAAGEQA